jgi:FkbM family methyltransferase
MVDSIKSSLRKNGLLGTLHILWHYFFFKLGHTGIYTFYFPAIRRRVHLRRGSSDFSVFRQIFMNYEYDVKYVHADTLQVIVDAGANIGLASLYFHTRFPKAKIVALEPDMDNYKTLLLNTTGIPVIVPLNEALWSRKADLALVNNGFGEWGIQVVETGDATGPTIRATDVSSMFKAHSINFVDVFKIDIEGAEWELFQSDYVPWLEKTGMIIIELHDNFRPGVSKAFYDAINAIPHRVELSGENVVVYNEIKQSNTATA